MFTLKMIVKLVFVLDGLVVIFGAASLGRPGTRCTKGRRTNDHIIFLYLLLALIDIYVPLDTE